MGDKELSLFKITGTFGKPIIEMNASCGKCNKTYDGSELIESEEKIENEFYHYRLTYSCPKGHVVLGADV